MIWFLISLAIIYFIVNYYEKNISRKGQMKHHREMMEMVGEEDVVYHNEYYNRLTQQSRVGENLPQRNCDNCGMALNPGEKFCPGCGQDISNWIKKSDRG